MGHNDIILRRGLFEKFEMLAFVLLIPLVSATAIVQTDLIDGHYKYKAAPGDGIEAYYGLWGIPAEVVVQFKEDPYVEVWALNQEGSGFSVHAQRKSPRQNGEKTTSKHEWIWQAPVRRHSPVGSKMIASASLVGPNTIQIIYLAEDQHVTEIQTMKFTAAGVEKTYVASKANEGTGETVVFKSFHERVNEEGLPIPFRFQYLPQWPLFAAPLVYRG